MQKKDWDDWSPVIVGAFTAAVFIAVTVILSLTLSSKQKELEKEKKTKKNGDPQSPARSKEIEKEKKDIFREFLGFIIIFTLLSAFMVALTIASIPTTGKAKPPPGSFLPNA